MVGEKNLFKDMLFKGPGKVSQAALGWGDLNFERPNDFLAMGMLHPIVLTLCVVWAVGRSAGAVAGEIDRGTMELLMSQPVPRNRLILAHFLVDLIVLPTICLSFFLGTQFGLAVVGDFVPDYTALKNLKAPNGQQMQLPIPENPQPLPVSGMGELPGLSNTCALMFAISGLTIALSAAGRSRWKVTGLRGAAGGRDVRAKPSASCGSRRGWVRPFTLFFYYQPQKVMLERNWLVDLGAAWSGASGAPESACRSPLARGLPIRPPYIHPPRLACSAVIDCKKSLDAPVSVAISRVCRPPSGKVAHIDSGIGHESRGMVGGDYDGGLSVRVSGPVRRAERGHRRNRHPVEH